MNANYSFAEYITNAKRLLKADKEGINPYDSYTVSPPCVEPLDPFSNINTFLSAEEMGFAAAAKSVYVLVAGGLGERLHYPGTKIALPISVLSMKSHLEHYCGFILSLQRRYAMVAHEHGADHEREQTKMTQDHIERNVPKDRFETSCFSPRDILSPIPNLTPNHSLMLVESSHTSSLPSHLSNNTNKNKSQKTTKMESNWQAQAHEAHGSVAPSSLHTPLPSSTLSLSLPLGTNASSRLKPGIKESTVSPPSLPMSEMIPLCIMTSQDTHAVTVQLLEEHSYFGLDSSQITLLCQQHVPSLASPSCQFALEPLESNVPIMRVKGKPHGHGDVHLLLHSHSSRPMDKWAKQDKRYVVFFQDTNSLATGIILSLLGTAEKSSAASVMAAVPRRPGDAVGAICRLERRRDHTNVSGTEGLFSPTRSPSTPSLPLALTINVEYNVIGALLKNNAEVETEASQGKGMNGIHSTAPTTTTTVQGEEVDSQGFSLLPGNINCFAIAFPTYRNMLARSGGKVADFVNPKYTDSTRTAFQTSCRLESMMQDFPRLLSPDDKVVICQYPPWVSFNPVKNPPAQGAQRQASGTNPECATASEAMIYEHARLAALVMSSHSRGRSTLADLLEYEDVSAKGLKKPATPHFIAPYRMPYSEFDEYEGVKVPVAPRVQFGTGFLLMLADLPARIAPGGINLCSQRSSIYLDGSGLAVRSMRVNGHCEIHCESGIRVLVDQFTEHNEGLEFIPISAKDASTARKPPPPEMVTRGYMVDARQRYGTNAVYYITNKHVNAIRKDSGMGEIRGEAETGPVASTGSRDLIILSDLNKHLFRVTNPAESARKAAILKEVKVEDKIAGKKVGKTTGKTIPQKDDKAKHGPLDSSSPYEGYEKRRHSNEISGLPTEEKQGKMR